MRRLLFLLPLFMFSLSLWGQVYTVGTYKTKSGDCSIRAELKKKKNDFKIERIFIDWRGSSYISLSPKGVSALTKALSALKNKFEEWKEIAIKNDVGSFSKPMNINFPSLTFINPGRFGFEIEWSPEWIFYVGGNNNIYCGFKGSFSDWTQTKSFSFSLFFSSAAQIESLISALDTDQILSKLKELAEKEENTSSGQDIGDLFQ